MPTNPTDAAVPRSANAYTGRIVALATLVVGFIGAAAPVVGNLDVSSTAGIVAGIAALTAIAVKYLEGWQRYEGRVDALQLAALTPTATPAARPGKGSNAAAPQPDGEPANGRSPVVPAQA